jgi:hypothetical protein
VSAGGPRPPSLSDPGRPVGPVSAEGARLHSWTDPILMPGMPGMPGMPMMPGMPTVSAPSPSQRLPDNISAAPGSPPMTSRPRPSRPRPSRLPLSSQAAEHYPPPEQVSPGRCAQFGSLGQTCYPRTNVLYLDPTASLRWRKVLSQSSQLKLRNIRLMWLSHA